MLYCNSAIFENIKSDKGGFYKRINNNYIRLEINILAMKMLFLFLLIPCNIFAQTESNDSFLVAKSNVTYQSIIDNVKMIDKDINCDNKGKSGVCYYELQNALRLDVIEYFDLSEKYDTELKQSIYKETPEYKGNLEKLKILQQKYLNNCLCLDLTDIEGFEISDYDLTKGGFTIKLGYASKSSLNYFFRYFEIKSIPFKTPISSIYTGVTNYDRLYFFNVSKQDAVNLEETRSSIKCILIFKPKGLRKETESLIYGYTTDNYYITTDKVRLILIDPNTDKVYLDKNFVLAKSVNKK